MSQRWLGEGNGSERSAILMGQNRAAQPQTSPLTLISGLHSTVFQTRMFGWPSCCRARLSKGPRKPATWVQRQRQETRKLAATVIGKQSIRRRRQLCSDCGAHERARSHALSWWYDADYKHEWVPSHALFWWYDADYKHEWSAVTFTVMVIVQARVKHLQIHCRAGYANTSNVLSQTLPWWLYKYKRCTFMFIFTVIIQTRMTYFHIHCHDDYTNTNDVPSHTLSRLLYKHEWRTFAYTIMVIIQTRVTYLHINYHGNYRRTSDRPSRTLSRQWYKHEWRAWAGNEVPTGTWHHRPMGPTVQECCCRLTKFCPQPVQEPVHLWPPSQVPSTQLYRRRHHSINILFLPEQFQFVDVLSRNMLPFFFL